MDRTITLKVGCWHLGIWLALATLAGSLTVWTCLEYNGVAGTDKTPGHIVLITAAVFSGPMCGIVANPSAGGILQTQAQVLTLILGFGVVLSWCPFLFIRRPVSRMTGVLVWMAFVAMSVLWFFTSLVSLAAFLS